MQTDAKDAEQLGFNKTSGINGILHLGPLNALLSAAGAPTVSAGSLGS